MKEGKLKHLELVQGVINRLANNSFLVKGWSITITLGAFGLFLDKNNIFILIALFVVVVLFWFIDSYYLRQEKLFRELYEASAGTTRDNLSMDIANFQDKVSSTGRLMFSYPNCLLYLTIVSLVIAQLIYKIELNNSIDWSWIANMLMPRIVVLWF